MACAALQVQRYGTGVLRGGESYRRENLARLAQGVLFAVGVLALVLAGRAGLGMVLALLAASQVAAAWIVLGGLPPRWRRPAWRLNRAALRGWLAEAGPLGLGDVLRGLTWNLDTLLLSLLQPASVVGLYSVAYRPLGPLNWVPFAVLTAVFPSFARNAVEDRAALARAFAASLRLLWVMSLPIAVVVCTCLSFLSFPFRFLLAALGRPDVYARLVLWVLVLEAVLESALIPEFGYLGACAGSLAGEAVFTAAGLYLCGRLGVHGVEYGAMARALPAAVALGLGLGAVRGASFPASASVLAALAFPVLYFVLCVALGAVRREEAARLWDVVVGALRQGRASVAAGASRGTRDRG
jgi:O-antigen/teichoic acid export membrane protein